MKKYQWMSGESGYTFGIPELTMEQAEFAFHPGDCQDSVNELIAEIDTTQIDYDGVRQELLRYGIEGIEDKNTHELLELIIWIACGDIQENSEFYEIQA